VCRQAFTTRTPERSPHEREAFTTRTRIVLNSGDASGDEEGVGRDESEEANRLSFSPSREGSTEIAAFAALKRAGITIGSPLTDEEIKALGYRPTARGWVPIKGAIHAA
jgi:hypothetical protein